MIAVGSFHMPRLFDRYMNATMFKQQESDRPNPPDRHDTLHAADSLELRQRLGATYSRVHERSPYTAMALRAGPLTTALLFGGAALAAWKLLGRPPR